MAGTSLVARRSLWHRVRPGPLAGTPIDVVSPAASRRHRHRVGTALVGAQFTLIALSLVPVGPVLRPGAPAAALVCLGAAGLVGGLALRAMGPATRIHPVPGEAAPLVTNGIYSVVRHPMYLAVGLAVLGVTLGSGRVLALVSLVGLVFVLPRKARFEDRLLFDKFGWQFAVYASHVPAFVPRARRRRRR